MSIQNAGRFGTLPQAAIHGGLRLYAGYSMETGPPAILVTMTGGASYLDVLNDEQRAAVLHEGRSLLILAGAGSGKTRVITTKIAYLIRERGLPPWSILAVTFTNKAAREMAARARLIDERADGAMLRTFHSFGAWFLRRNAEKAGLSSGFVIYDDEDSAALLSTLLPNWPRGDVRAAASRIARAKDYFLSPDDPELDRIDYRPEFRTAYALYEERLRKIGNVDFGDLIKKPVEVLRRDRELAEKFRARFQVIMVDEYQDSNVAQFALLRELRGDGARLCVVGDDDQSIYRFRGAEVRNILEFPDQFPGTDIIRLERNYRSFAPILSLASSVVDHNRGRLGKTLRAQRGGGKEPVLAFLPNQDEEASYCAELITRSVKEGARFSDWAVLYRTNAQSLGFETEFLRRRIPYLVVGSLKFYEREEIKDALALLCFAVNPRDEVAFRRIVNKPARGVGGASLEKIVEARSFDEDLLGAARRVKLPPKASAGVEAFASVIERGRALLSGADDAALADNAADDGYGIQAGEGLSVCVAALVRDSGLAKYHATHEEISGYQRAGNLQELVNAASLYPATGEGLLEFLEYIELDRSMMENRPENRNEVSDAVTLITLHNTKGLEFRRVVLTGLEQGVFPRDDKGGDDLEEERRLFYVGATRAMDELYLTSCALRRIYGRTSPMMPSLFLREADSSALRVIGRAPAGFTGVNFAPANFADDGAEITRKNAAPGQGRAGGGSKTSSDGRWTLGERVFHDDQGYGYIAGMKEGEDGPVIQVSFENGYRTSFLSRYQSGNFMKIGSDD